MKKIILPSTLPGMPCAPAQGSGLPCHRVQRPVVKVLGLLILIVVVVFGVLYAVLPYRIKTVCFGDVCPQNGGTYLLYKKTYTEEECTAKGGKPITGIGWIEVYAGCSPDNAFSRLIEGLNKQVD